MNYDLKKEKKKKRKKKNSLFRDKKFLKNKYNLINMLSFIFFYYIFALSYYILVH